MLNPDYILVDGSYYIFYRFYATMRWWKISNLDLDTNLLGLDFEPVKNALFMEKFQKMFISKLQELPFRVGATKDTRLFVAKDCLKQDIWRKAIYPEYKQTRIPDKMMAGIFTFVYENQLFEQAGISPTHIISAPHLEADDCIALFIKKITNDGTSGKSKNWLQMLKPTQILIIASDHDYLQLCGKHIHLMNLAYKQIEPYKHALQLKLILGDKSDNIPSIFPKCGIKTALKYADNETLFLEKLHDPRHPEYLQKYHQNQLLIDFANIPEELQLQLQLL